MTTAPLETSPARQTEQRISALDAVRGLVMVIMALDHVRDLIHRGAMTGSPTDLATTTPLLFFTRWITHLCAPTFMFTAGLGAWLWWQRGRTRRELSVFLLTRGLWLIGLELAVMQVAYNFDVTRPYPVMLIVLWALGLCMVLLAGLVWLPIGVLGAVSMAIILLHNTLDGVRATQFGALAPAWYLLHQVGGFQAMGRAVIVGYPLVPWIAVMALGFALGPMFGQDARARRPLLLGLGGALVLGFVALRAINGYGDPVPWTTQASPIDTGLSFLNTTKYPPSLTFLLMTLGPTFLLIAWFDRWDLSAAHPLAVFDRVPLFYFVVHFYVAHTVSALLALLRYGSTAWSFIFRPVPSMGGPAATFPTDFGFDLWVAYAAWMGIVVGLYPLCRWFASLKARRTDWWLRYL